MKPRIVIGLMLSFITQVSLGAPLGTAFTYQGRLNGSGAPANGFYDFEFGLVGEPTGATPLLGYVTTNRVPVSNGLFTVRLDYGTGAFDGLGRWLQIGVRSNGLPTYSVMSPRQPITPSPYAFRSERAGTALTADALSGSCIGCVAGTALANGSVTDAKVANVAGSKITGTVPVAAIPGGSSNYIQNGTAQQTANFAITGTGTAASFNYLEPQTAYFAVNEAAFTARDGVLVSKGTGNGGAYPTSTSEVGLIAPINVPHGATITNIRFIYVDNSANSLTLFVSANYMTGGYNRIATHITPGPANPAVQIVDVPVSPGWLVDNSTASLAAFADPDTTWMSFSMQIRGVIVTYTMPRPAR